ncbi:hypothetical protein PQ472_05280 [Lacticaseibacillus pabuli]|uniref:Uncharacterized protein n=1 Tax=Lacticaseibacillus pabuli TaxID=3025672 RepID=A0ABY7X0G7_9LACO|nr:hypothetical protein [Lacticaseibacillus sp. KACC 23028]WDF83650.1 hypothetical protein PQ472_05280 [Lacticaseibacillus sp. KACC 23028]
MRELRRLVRKLRVNHSWIFIGLETLIVGMYFVACRDSVVGYTAGHISVGGLDDWFPAVVWILLGGFVVINNLFDVWPDRNRIAAIAMMGLWGFYFGMMLARDLNDPHPPVVGLATIFYGIIMLRILVLLLFDDTHAHKHRRKGGH